MGYFPENQWLVGLFEENLTIDKRTERNKHKAELNSCIYTSIAKLKNVLCLSARLDYSNPEQFIKTDKWPETPLKNVFPAILFSTKRVSVNRSSILYNIIHPKQQRKDFEQ